MDINDVAITGEVISARKCNEMCELVVEVERPSGEKDLIEVLSKETAEGFVRICGEVRSRQNKGLSPYIYADYIMPIEEMYSNECVVEGHICQKPYYKKLRTREVTAFMVAIEGCRLYYVPVVCWGRTARRIAGYHEGDKVVIKGRCQTRNYIKGKEIKMAKEISAYEIM